MKANLVLLSLVATGCGLDEDKFLDKFAKELCDKEFDCAEEEDYESKFDNEEECVEFFQGIMQPSDDEADCEYNSEAAHDCLGAIEDLECDYDGGEIPECNDVYEGECVDQ